MLSESQMNKLGELLSGSLSLGHWRTIFINTNFREYDNSNFRDAVRFGNDDLSHTCMRITEEILTSDEENIKHFWNIQDLRNIVRRKDPELYRFIEDYISGDAQKTVTTSPINNTNENIYNVLKDAEVLLEKRGPGEAYDRIHTALHGTLKLMCDKSGIVRKDNNRVDELLSLINNHLKAKKDSERNKVVFEMLRSAIAILNKTNELRNHHSNAHPNDGLLNNADARFAINLIRSIMSYVDDLLG
ncbi:abortive infection family protein [Candidatus Pantoea soli]|nr:abortive infection family protein [Pantoea soli]